ncbi:hypothetical protein CPB84DRAFT_1843262 [Gymnopilus junonius]|uniref:Uncharacterized protein n=1 Tax=Gymnopilus junonius TaxID=109634 RepID=A0A9P5NU83_GYMJU|nr:hypothetical protein CPB84DRAFT_1843262 [Gymnopilus junonius]
MASLVRLARLAPSVIQSRSIAYTGVVRNEVPSSVGAVNVQKKPIGFSLASSIAAYQLLDEYQKASAALQASVEELKLNTDKVSAHVRRIEAVEKDLRALADASATKEDTSRVRAEVKSFTMAFTSSSWIYEHMSGAFNKISTNFPNMIQRKFESEVEINDSFLP